MCLSKIAHCVAPLTLTSPIRGKSLVFHKFVWFPESSELHWTPSPDSGSDSDGVGIGVGVTKKKLFGIGVGIGVEEKIIFGGTE